jgi:hypothetical protein
MGSQKKTMRLWDYCGSRLCSVVLRRALGSICNGHPASEVVKNQLHTIVKNSISTVRLATNQEAGSLNLFRRVVRPQEWICSTPARAAMPQDHRGQGR